MLNIRKATTDDAVEIQRILNLSWFTTYKNIFTENELGILTSKWHKLEKITYQIARNEYTYLVAENNNKLVGVCSAYISEGNVLSIEKLHILPEYKGLGIGSKLLGELINNFKNIKTLVLEVVKNNNNAISFYENKGFVKVKEMDIVVNGVNVPCYVMERQLKKF